MKQLLTTLLILIVSIAAAQSQKISGKVIDEDGDPLIGVNVKLKDRLIGSVTDAEGYFEFEVDQPFPFDLIISSVGFETQILYITSASSFPINVSMAEQVLLGNEVVVSASRVEEYILESPVAVEKMGILDVQQAPAQDFYGSLVNYKNVDMTTQSFTFRSISLRGFNSNGNTRMVQLIDGVDNQAPGLNFPVGNIAGLSDLDVESIELLPGASSALYGPNAINGIVIMNSKSPFDYPGLSVSLKGGVNHVDGRDTEATPFTDLSFRYAKSINDKFAFKISGSYLDAEDWYGTDTRDQNAGLDPASTRENNTGYDGVNTFGDETSTTLDLDNDGTPETLISRTGYSEQDLVNDYSARSIKFSGALHYRFNANLEGILQANLGSGQNVYTGIDRYSIDNFSLNTYKAELRGSNFTLRAYTTRENSGDSYAIGTLGVLMNEAYSPSNAGVDENGIPQGWFADYQYAYQGLFGIPGMGFTPGDHNEARRYADRNRLEPGTSTFDEVREGFIGRPLSDLQQGGAKFLDRTKLYAYEGSYNLSNQIDFAEIIVGANYRVYALESEGTLFALDDNGEEFSISEFGGFVQASKKFFNDALKLTGSLRYDKNENFDGRTTPRISGVWSFLSGHNLRLSYQTGFRMPTTQNQYIDLLTPDARLIGGLPMFREKYNFDSNPVYDQTTWGTFIATQDPAVLNGTEINETSFELEQNETIEFGYRGLIGERLLIDTYYYNSVFNNFSGNFPLFQSSVEGDVTGLFAPQVYQTTVSLDQEVKSQGLVFGTSYALNSGFKLSGNYAWNELTNRDDLPDGFQSGFNTPEHKVNLSISNRKLTDRIGFNLAWRWQDAFLWESSFAVGEIPSFHTMDLQVSYSLPNLKSRLKVGGSNILNERYEQAVGNPTVGAIWYASITFDEFFR